MTDPAAFLRRNASGLRYIDVEALFAVHGQKAWKMPRSIRILAEAAARGFVEGRVSALDLASACAWSPQAHVNGPELRFPVGRVILQDASGLPLLVDLAALRDIARREGGNPAKVNPMVPVAMVIDHSVTIDHARGPDALAFNLRRELDRNEERYRFARWAANAFDNLIIIPPGNGIVHQIHMERLVEVVSERNGWQFADLVIGTDSHTTMINGLGVLGWGVGGIEAEEAIVGETCSLPMPEVVGVELRGALTPGVGAADAALTLTKWLRTEGVVGAIVEFFGAGTGALSVPDRATIANMAPEYGATAALFPLDEAVLDYLAHKGFKQSAVARIREHGLAGTDEGRSVRFSRRLSFDLAAVEASVSGPSRPNQQIPVSALARSGEPEPRPARAGLRSGDIVIAAITSCTNTANPRAMVTAGLLARNALARGLSVPDHVRCTLAPGSRQVARYLQELGLAAPLDALGFSVSAFGCATCVGNSGPLDTDTSRQVIRKELDVAAVLSGNRNFEARIHPLVRSNFLMSPALVVAFALKGHVHCDIRTTSLGSDSSGQPIRLGDIWPEEAEITRFVERIAPGVPPIFMPDGWSCQSGAAGLCWPWEETSSYFIEPPFFKQGFAEPLRDLVNARPLLVLGDSVTTDHISPVGAIDGESATGQFLQNSGVPENALNTYAARRGNHEAMLRGTFANRRLENSLAGRQTGPWTRHLPGGERLPVHVAAERYRQAGTDMVIFAGQAYGMGSARDWAAKGTRLLGVRAVIAKGFERIHRSNLVRAGVVPLRIDDAGFSPDRLDCSADIVVSSTGLATLYEAEQPVRLVIESEGTRTAVNCVADVRTQDEIDLLRAGGLFARMRERFAPTVGAAATIDSRNCQEMA